VLDVATADATIGTAPDSFDSALATGDADGDGIRDLVMTDPGVRDRAGAVYVMPGTGSRLAGEVDLAPTTTAFIGHEVRVTCFDGGDGCTSGEFVGAVFDAGDLTGDGLLDALVTAPTWDTFPGDAMGARAYLVSPASIR
ncbi:MAG TPA: FG-GAP repeat protein, partial [Kofleriaceae bacterium]|nr:FG-GAP repeat protein [Kofleriaceae bacterium]